MQCNIMPNTTLWPFELCGFGTGSALDAVGQSARSRQLAGGQPDVSSVGGGSVLVPRSRGGCTALCAARSLKLNWFCSGPSGFFAAPCPFPACSGDVSSAPEDVATSLPSMAACASCLLAASAWQ